MVEQHALSHVDEPLDAAHAHQSVRAVGQRELVERRERRLRRLVARLAVQDERADPVPVVVAQHAVDDVEAGGGRDEVVAVPRAAADVHAVRHRRADDGEDGGGALPVQLAGAVNVDVLEEREPARPVLLEVARREPQVAPVGVARCEAAWPAAHPDVLARLHARDELVRRPVAAHRQRRLVADARVGAAPEPLDELLVHLRVVQHRVVVPARAAHHHVVGAVSRRPARHRRRVLVEVRVAHEHPEPLGGVVQLEEALGGRRTADEPDVLPGQRRVRPVSVRPRWRLDRTHPDAVVDVSVRRQRAEHEDADLRMELNLDACLDVQRRARHDGQVAGNDVRRGALRQSQRRLNAAAERTRQVERWPATRRRRHAGVHVVADQVRVVLGDRVAVPVVEVEDARAYLRLVGRAPPVLRHVEVALEARRLLRADQLVVQLRIVQQVPVDGDVLQSGDADRVARRHVGAPPAARRRRRRRPPVPPEAVVPDARLDPRRVRRVARYRHGEHVPPLILRQLVALELEVLLRPADGHAAARTHVPPEPVAGDRRVAIEAADVEPERRVPLERRVVHVDAVVVQIALHQVHLRQRDPQPAAVPLEPTAGQPPQPDVVGELGAVVLDHQPVAVAQERARLDLERHLGDADPPLELGERRRVKVVVLADARHVQAGAGVVLERHAEEAHRLPAVAEEQVAVLVRRVVVVARDDALRVAA